MWDFLDNVASGFIKRAEHVHVDRHGNQIRPGDRIRIVDPAKAQPSAQKPMPAHEQLEGDDAYSWGHDDAFDQLLQKPYDAPEISHVLPRPRDYTDARAYHGQTAVIKSLNPHAEFELKPDPDEPDTIKTMQPSKLTGHSIAKVVLDGGGTSRQWEGDHPRVLSDSIELVESNHKPEMDPHSRAGRNGGTGNRFQSGERVYIKDDHPTATGYKNLMDPATGRHSGPDTHSDYPYEEGKFKEPTPAGIGHEATIRDRSEVPWDGTPSGDPWNAFTVHYTRDDGVHRSIFHDRVYKQGEY